MHATSKTETNSETSNAVATDSVFHFGRKGPKLLLSMNGSAYQCHPHVLVNKLYTKADNALNSTEYISSAI